MALHHDVFSRRDFLTATAAAGVGLLISRAGARAAEPAPAGKTPPSGKIRLGLVGVGAQGRVLIDSLMQIEGIQLVAIADMWDYAREYGRKYL